MKAIPKVLEKYPAQKFVIAGMPVPGFSYDESIVEKYKANIEIVPKFIANDQLIKYIERAKFVVCPYRDATQSGVLITALAVGKMAVATDVGSFSEYITDNVSGLLAHPDPVSIAAKIIEALDNNKYKKIEQNLHPGFSVEVAEKNKNIIVNAYENY